MGQLAVLLGPVFGLLWTLRLARAGVGDDRIAWTTAATTFGVALLPGIAVFTEPPASLGCWRFSVLPPFVHALLFDKAEDFLPVALAAEALLGLAFLARRPTRGAGAWCLVGAFTLLMTVFGSLFAMGCPEV